MDLPFNEAGVSITRNALSVAGQVFALRDVQDVRVVTVPRKRGTPTVIGLLGVVVAAFGLRAGSVLAAACGVMLAVVGVLNWYVQDVTHRLLVVSDGGTREALSSVDLAFVERVADRVRGALAEHAAARTE